MVGENQAREYQDWKKFTEGFYYMVTHMTSALYTKDTLTSWYREDETKKKQLWELITVSDMAYTIFVLENHGDVWKQERKFHPENIHTSTIEKEKFAEYEKLTGSQMESPWISQENIRHYLKIKPKLTHGQRKLPFSNAFKTEGVDFY